MSFWHILIFLLQNSGEEYGEEEHFDDDEVEGEEK